jgi:glycosyltransferase involved in cell wall biosynthesis
VRLGIKKGNLVVGIRAVSEYQKNFDLFIRALNILPEDIKNQMTVVTIQNTGMLSSVTGLSEIVELPWSNDDELISDFYNSLDIFVMPSRYETFGFMSLESMSHGVPVIALADTAIDEICNLALNGFRLQNDSPIELAQVLSQLVTDRSELKYKSLLAADWVRHNND